MVDDVCGVGHAVTRDAEESGASAAVLHPVVTLFCADADRPLVETWLPVLQTEGCITHVMSTGAGALMRALRSRDAPSLSIVCGSAELAPSRVRSLVEAFSRARRSGDRLLVVDVSPSSRAHASEAVLRAVHGLRAFLDAHEGPHASHAPPAWSGAWVASHSGARPFASTSSQWTAAASAAEGSHAAWPGPASSRAGMALGLGAGSSSALVTGPSLNGRRRFTRMGQAFVVLAAVLACLTGALLGRFATWPVPPRAVARLHLQQPLMAPTHAYPGLHGVLARPEVQAGLETGELHVLDTLLATELTGVSLDWYTASARCHALERAGIDAWRLPTRDALERLRGAGMLRQGRYWSSTSAPRKGLDVTSYVTSTTTPASRATPRRERANVVCVTRTL